MSIVLPRFDPIRCPSGHVVVDFAAYAPHADLLTRAKYCRLVYERSDDGRITVIEPEQTWRAHGLWGYEKDNLQKAYVQLLVAAHQREARKQAITALAKTIGKLADQSTFDESMAMRLSVDLSRRLAAFLGPWTESCTEEEINALADGELDTFNEIILGS